MTPATQPNLATGRAYDGGENVSIQTRLRRRALIAVGSLAFLVLLQDWAVTALAAAAHPWARADLVFLVGTACHGATCAALVYLFRPRQLQLLHNTRSATAEAAAEAEGLGWKAEEYYGAGASDGIGGWGARRQQGGGGVGGQVDYEDVAPLLRRGSDDSEEEDDQLGGSAFLI